MAKETFHISIPGDNTVGIPDGEATVTIEEDGLPDYDEEQIGDFKDCLASMFDTMPTHVLTQAEFDAEQKAFDETVCQHEKRRMERKMMEHDATDSVSLTKMSDPDPGTITGKD